MKPNEDEEKYFAQRDAEKRADLRKGAERAAQRMKERQYIGLAVGSKDDHVLEEIRALGFTGNTARVFDLLPLIHVAWSDGKIQRGERAAILDIVTQRGITDEDDGYQYVASLLETRPSEEFFEATTKLLQRILPGKAGETLVDMCLRVAAASGGMLGLGEAVSEDEKSAIEKVAQALGDTAHESFRQRLKS